MLHSAQVVKLLYCTDLYQKKEKQAGKHSVTYNIQRLLATDLFFLLALVLLFGSLNRQNKCRQCAFLQKILDMLKLFIYLRYNIPSL